MSDAPDRLDLTLSGQDGLDCRMDALEAAVASLAESMRSGLQGAEERLRKLEGRMDSLESTRQLLAARVSPVPQTGDEGHAPPSGWRQS